MPLAFSDVRKSFIDFITNSNVWNGLVSNAFSVGLIVSIIILLILVLSYDENKSTTKNMISFILYSSIFSIVMFVIHDTVLIRNYKLKNTNEIEKNIISGGYNSNTDAANYHSEIVPIQVSGGSSEYVHPVSQSVPIPERGSHQESLLTPHVSVSHHSNPQVRF